MKLFFQIAHCGLHFGNLVLMVLFPLFKKFLYFIVGLRAFLYFLIFFLDCLHELLNLWVLLFQLERKELAHFLNSHLKLSNLMLILMGFLLIRSKLFGEGVILLFDLIHFLYFLKELNFDFYILILQQSNFLNKRLLLLPHLLQSAF